MSENMQQCPSCGELVPIEYVICVWCGFDLTAEHIRRSGIRIGRKEAILRMRKVVINPVQAFKEIVLIPDLRGGRMILYFIGFMITLNMLAIFSKLDGLEFNKSDQNFAQQTVADPATEEPAWSISVRFVMGVVFLVIQPLILLLIFNLVWRYGTRFIVYFSKTFGGTGDREKVRAVIGYSLLPVLFGWTLAWITRALSPVEKLDDSSYSSVEEGIRVVTTTGIGRVGEIFIFLGWIWAAVLGIIGIARATRLSYIESIIVAGIPYLVFLNVVTSI